MRNLFDVQSFAAARLFAIFSLLTLLAVWPAWHYSDFGAVTAVMVVWCAVAAYITQNGARDARRTYGREHRAMRHILRDIRAIDQL